MIETPYFDSIDRRLFPTRKWSGLHAPRHWCLLSPDAVFSSINQSGNLKINLTFTPCPYMWITNLRHLFEIDESTPPQALLSTKNPILVVIFTLIDYILIFLRLPTSNAHIQYESYTRLSRAFFLSFRMYIAGQFLSI